MSVSIYALKLQGNKYYIGKSNVPRSRILQHFSKNGSEWTRMYPPIDVVEETKGDNFDEDKITKQYMETYGIDNVRGGSYCQARLQPAQLKYIQQELQTAQDRCYLCGQQGHLAGRCPQKQVTAPTRVTKCVTTRATNECFRCRRKGHWAPQCYAKRDVFGNDLESESSDDEWHWSE